MLYGIQIYIIIGLSWACIASYWLDKVPQLFLSTWYRIKFLMVVTLLWPCILYLSIYRGIKKTILLEIMCMIYQIQYTKLITIYHECHDSLLSNPHDICRQYRVAAPQVTAKHRVDQQLKDIVYTFYLLTHLTYLSQHERARSFSRLWRLFLR